MKEKNEQEMTENESKKKGMRAKKPQKRDPEREHSSVSLSGSSISF